MTQTVKKYHDRLVTAIEAGDMQGIEALVVESPIGAVKTLDIFRLKAECLAIQISMVAVVMGKVIQKNK